MTDLWRVIIFDEDKWAVWYSSSGVHLDQLIGLEPYVHASPLARAFSVRAEHAERVVDMMNRGGT